MKREHQGALDVMTACVALIEQDELTLVEMSMAMPSVSDLAPAEMRFRFESNNRHLPSFRGYAGTEETVQFAERMMLYWQARHVELAAELEFERSER